ncbi:hypothetical protein [Evansella clarkii]|jgi:hypothetical protein|uniref:hypothetical protein n=1 Tax=Evansella clarkii TaxID=79879 RepID=UPI000B42E8B4|nr:hypothetical protein [Evansella clarkii]
MEEQITDYISRLKIRRDHLLKEMKEEQTVELRSLTLGEIKAIDLVIKELTTEFLTDKEGSKIT